MNQLYPLLDLLVVLALLVLFALGLSGFEETVVVLLALGVAHLCILKSEVSDT